MHEVNWCENCGAIIRIELPHVARSLTELVSHLVCDCRGRPRPANSDNR